MIITRIFKKAITSGATYYARLRRARRSHLYCVGTAKSGTHSIDSMFDDTVRSRHEPEDWRVIPKILDISAGRIPKTALRDYVQRRDRRLYLDVDSSQLNFFLLDILLEEFSDALFLLTIRDPYSWLDSYINDSLRRTSNWEWTRLRELRFRASAFSHPPEERALREHGLYTLDGYLSYWASHNQKVLSTVPEDQLMVVRTDEITQRAHDIAEFAGLPREAVRLEKSHAFQNPKKYSILRQLEPSYLEERVQEYCTPLIERFFPEIQSVEDARI
jgi:hypothetical protein